MAVRDLAAYFDGGIDYPNVPSKAHPKGKTYRVESPDAKTGLWLSQLAHLGGKAAFGGNVSAKDLTSLKLDDEGEQDLYQRVMGCTDECEKLQEDGTKGPRCGSTYDQMFEDGVAWMTLSKIGQDAFLYFALDESVANQSLEGQGKAVAVPNRQEKRAAAKKAGRKSSPASGGSANRTPRRASTGSSTSPAASGKGAKTA